MSTFDWQTLFPPVLKKAWAEKAERDLGPDTPLSKLNWPCADGLTIDPYYTKEDISSQSLFEKTPLQSIKKQGWLICEPISLDQDAGRMQAYMQSAINAGAQAFAFEGKFTSVESLPALLNDIKLEHLYFTSASASPLERLALAKMIAAGPGFSNTSTTTIQLLSAPDDLNQAPAVDWIKRHKARTLVINTTNLVFPSVVEELIHLMGEVDTLFVKLLQAALDIEDILSRFHLIIPIGSSFYLEIAKLRATRWLMGLLVNTLSPETKGPLPIQVTADTTTNSFTNVDPHTNLLRTTTRAMSAIIGGCDALIIRPFASEAPDQASRLARNTHHILKHEVYLDKVIDPGAGSYYIETITRQLVERVWQSHNNMKQRVDIA